MVKEKKISANLCKIEKVKWRKVLIYEQAFQREIGQNDVSKGAIPDMDKIIVDKIDIDVMKYYSIFLEFGCI